MYYILVVVPNPFCLFLVFLITVILVCDGSLIRLVDDKTPCYLINLLSLLSHYIQDNESHQKETYMNRCIPIISTLLARAPENILEVCWRDFS